MGQPGLVVMKMVMVMVMVVVIVMAIVMVMAMVMYRRKLPRTNCFGRHSYSVNVAMYLYKKAI